MEQRKIWKGIVAGAVGGIVASWTMNQFQKAWTAASEEAVGKLRKKSKSEPEDPTLKTADGISEAIRGRKLTKAQKENAAPSFDTPSELSWGPCTEPRRKLLRLQNH